jgi:2-polyprenyl-3-methyl-5-hydroxy-6-metoxy-1,4-benzoquinol methylase
MREAATKCEPALGGADREAPDLASSGEDYATRFSGSVGEFLLDVQSRALLSMVDPWRGGSALDVGGGHGQVVGPLHSSGFTVTVLGSRAECWGRAQQTFGEKVEFAAGSLVHPPFDRESFDVVTAFRLLAHVSDWRRMIRGLCSVARHAVILDFPVASNRTRLAGPLFHLKKKLEGNTRPFRLFSLAEVEAAFAEEGFAHTSVFRQFALPMALHRTLRKVEVSRCSERWLRSAGVTDRLGSPVILLATRDPVPEAVGATNRAAPVRGRGRAG